MRRFAEPTILTTRVNSHRRTHHRRRHLDADGASVEVVPHGDLTAESLKLAERLCKSAPLAVRATKEVAVRTRNLPWVEVVRFGETTRLVAGRTEDVAEARAAVREKRPPKWRAK